MATTAQMITAALGGRWHAGRGMCRCVVHNDKTPSLRVRDGDVDGRILVKCFAGCDARDILDVLRRRGILGSDVPRVHPNFTRTRAREPEQVPDRAALDLWQTAQPAKGSPVEKYLRGRGITLIPPSIRCGRRMHAGMVMLPTMTCSIQSPDGQIIAVQETLLTLAGKKAAAAVSRINTGSLGAGAVRLAGAGEVLGLAEGVESALSAMQLTGIPCWASLGAARMHRVDIPDHVRELHVFADNDQPGRDAADRVVSEQKNRRAIVNYPLNGPDWNDQLKKMCA
jgi:hypothetical protein